MPPPARWDAYTPMGKVIPGTKIIACKVPLKEELMANVDQENRFSPATFMKKVQELGEKLAVVVDLTFTLKYYSKDDFIREGVEYKKIFTKGHEIPDQFVFQEFADTVKHFSGGSNNLIAVHCTHGVNRTGYLICRYMIEELNFEPEEAIRLFNEARGHNLERVNYLEDLHSRKPGRSSPRVEKPASESSSGGSSNEKRKTRWRNNRSEHPDWRRSGKQQGMYWEHRREPQQSRSSHERGDNKRSYWTAAEENDFRSQRDQRSYNHHSPIVDQRDERRSDYDQAGWGVSSQRGRRDQNFANPYRGYAWRQDDCRLHGDGGWDRSQGRGLQRTDWDRQRDSDSHTVRRDREWDGNCHRAEQDRQWKSDCHRVQRNRRWDSDSHRVEWDRQWDGDCHRVEQDRQWDSDRHRAQHNRDLIRGPSRRDRSRLGRDREGFGHSSHSSEKGCVSISGITASPGPFESSLENREEHSVVMNERRSGLYDADLREDRREAAGSYKNKTRSVEEIQQLDHSSGKRKDIQQCDVEGDCGDCNNIEGPGIQIADTKVRLEDDVCSISGEKVESANSNIGENLRGIDTIAAQVLCSADDVGEDLKITNKINGDLS